MSGCHDNVGSNAAGGCQSGSQRLFDYIMGRWGLGSFGCYNPASRAGSGWSLHREGRAIDIAVPPNRKAQGDAAFAWAVANADQIGLQEIQWWGKIWTSKRSGEGIRTDTSAARNLHYDHIHLGQCWAGARGWVTPAGATSASSVDWAALWPYLEARRIEEEAVAGYITLDNNKHGTQDAPDGTVYHVWFSGGQWRKDKPFGTTKLVPGSSSFTVQSGVAHVIATQTDGGTAVAWYANGWQQKYGV